MDKLIAFLKILSFAAALSVVIISLAKFYFKEKLTPKQLLSIGLRSFLAALFIFSAYAKLYGMSVYGAITTFEQKQLITMGFSDYWAPYFSRFIIGAELALGLGFLQPHYLRKLILPLSALLLVVFNIHLAYSMMNNVGGSCGCFGDLLPMSPTEAFIKNVITFGIVAWLWILIKEEQHSFNHNFFVALSIALTSILFMFLIAPIQPINNDNASLVIIDDEPNVVDPIKDTSIVLPIENKTIPVAPAVSTDPKIEEKPTYEPKKNASGYAKHAPGIDVGRKLLLFFAPGCEHCQETAKKLNEMAKKDKNFPKMFVIFMNEEPEKIPGFFEFAGRKFSHTILDVGAFWTLVGSRDTPGVLYLWNGNEVAFFDGINENEFKPEKLRKALDKMRID